MSQESKFCHKCGAPLPSGSSFCPNCGTPVAPAGAVSGPGPVPPSPPYAPYSERHHHREEKEEKYEKQEKGEKSEKGRGGDIAGAITGGLVLVLLGVLFYLAQTNYITITWSNWWEYFIIGLGFILIIQGLVRWGSRGRMYTGSFIGGAVLIVVGAVFVSEANIELWPLILVVIGIAVVASAFTGRRRAPAP
jgi:hypothetical protein